MLLETPRLSLRCLAGRDSPALCRETPQNPPVMYAYAHAFSVKEAGEWPLRQQVRCREDRLDALGFDQVYSILRGSSLFSQRAAIRNGMLTRNRMIKQYYHQEMPPAVFSVRAREDGGKGNRL